MKKLIFLLLAAGMFAFNACKPKDADIQKAVETALASVDGVSSSVSEGVVTLTGTVASEDTKAAAETALKAIKGVKSITNNIQVVLPVISGDDVLTEGLKTALAAFSTVTGTVKDSVITLTGEIARGDLQKVIQAAQALRPKKVENQLTIK
ncbi:MAG: BON domain-containing protein [Chitinophagaceae bacterium]|jgi:osmotically-inducible protein OsmY|nr:BON domain-containing protein [Chitinophagaceae bacterium]